MDVGKELEPASAIDQSDVVPIGAQLERGGEARESPAQDEHTLALLDRTLHRNHSRLRMVHGPDDSGAPFRRSRSYPYFKFRAKSVICPCPDSRSRGLAALERESRCLEAVSLRRYTHAPSIEGGFWRRSDRPGLTVGGDRAIASEPSASRVRPPRRPAERLPCPRRRFRPGARRGFAPSPPGPRVRRHRDRTRARRCLRTGCGPVRDHASRGIGSRDCRGGSRHRRGV